jgi:hypothetical protein
MKKIVEEISGEGFEKLLGEYVTLFCCRYIYHGKLIGVNETCVLLDDAGFVFDTGALSDTKFTTEEKIPNKQWYVSISSIESFGKLK